MADHAHPSPIGSSTQGRKSPPRPGTVYPISCTHCRQRKIKCDKVHPCVPCQRSSFVCVFPERARHPKKKKAGSKATNDELLLRLSRMEQLIGQLDGDGKTFPDARRKSSHTPESVDTTVIKEESSERRISRENSQGSTGDGLNRFIGSGFWRSLTNEVSILTRIWPLARFVVAMLYN